MSIKSCIAATIAAMMTVCAVPAIALTIRPSTPIQFNDVVTHIAKSGDEFGDRITLAELVVCDCANSNRESQSKRTGAGAVAPHAGIRFSLLRKKNMADTKSKEEVPAIRPPSHLLAAECNYHI